MRAHYNHLDPFLTEDDAATMLRLAENFGSFGPYANEGENDGIGEDLPQRFDAAFQLHRAWHARQRKQRRCAHRCGAHQLFPRDLCLWR